VPFVAPAIRPLVLPFVVSVGRPLVLPFVASTSRPLVVPFVTWPLVVPFVASASRPLVVPLVVAGFSSEMASSRDSLISMVWSKSGTSRPSKREKMPWESWKSLCTAISHC